MEKVSEGQAMQSLKGDGQLKCGLLRDKMNHILIWQMESFDAQSTVCLETPAERNKLYPP